MTIYEYRCRDCRTVRDSTTHSPGDLGLFCTHCDRFTTHARRFSFAFRPPMHEHFNHTVNRPISSMTQFRDELRRQSEVATERTGIEHSYAPVEWGDAAAVGATNEGIEESNRVRAERGEPLLPTIPDA